MPTLDLFPTITNRPIGHLDTEEFETASYFSKYNKEDIEIVKNLWAIRVNILLEELESYGIFFNSFEDIMQKPNYVWHNFTKYDMSLGQDGIANNDEAYYRYETICEGIKNHLGCGTFGDFVVPPELLNYFRNEYREGYIPDITIPKETLEKCKEMHSEWNNYASQFSIPAFNNQAIIGIMGALYVEGGLNDYIRRKGGMSDGASGIRTINTAEAKGSGPGGASAGSAGECWFGLTFWNSKIPYINYINQHIQTGRKIPTDPNAYQTELRRGANGDASAVCLATASMQAQWYMLLKYIQNSNKYKDITSDDPLTSCIAVYLYKAAPGAKTLMEDAKTWVEKYKSTHIRLYGQGKPNYKPYNGWAKQICYSMLLAQYILEDKDPKDFEYPWKQ